MKVMISPGKYVQAKDEIFNLDKYIAQCGKSAYGIIAQDIYNIYGEEIIANAKGKAELHLEQFKGECSQTEISRLVEDLKSKQSDVVIGMGGGKALDTAKAVAYYAKLPVIVIPTAASTDAPCSALSVIYKDNGEFDEYLLLPKNPEIVLVDSRIAGNAPVRFTVAGIGDALATYYEARACFRSGAHAMAGGKCSVSAFSLATACRDTLFSDGLRAKLACEQKTISQAVENILEANIYLSGIGFESGGLAAAHAVHNGLTVLKECHHILHGEKVAFGTLVQLVLENAPMEEIQQVLSFCKSVGLPTNLSQLGIKVIEPEKIMAVAKASCAENETIHNMPFKVTADDVYSAILVADQLGRM